SSRVDSRARDGLDRYAGRTQHPRRPGQRRGGVVGGDRGSAGTVQATGFAGCVFSPHWHARVLVGSARTERRGRGAHAGASRSPSRQSGLAWPFFGSRFSSQGDRRPDVNDGLVRFKPTTSDRPQLVPSPDILTVPTRGPTRPWATPRLC